LVRDSNTIQKDDYLFIYLGPYGDRDDQQVFVQKVVPFETNQIYVRFCSTGRMNIFKNEIKLVWDFIGRRVAVVRSVDSSPISCFTIHECEGPSRLSTRPRRFIFTGHDNGLLNNLILNKNWVTFFF